MLADQKEMNVFSCILSPPAVVPPLYFLPTFSLSPSNPLLLSSFPRSIPSLHSS